MSEVSNDMEPPSYWTQNKFLKDAERQLMDRCWDFSCDQVADMVSPRLADDKTLLINDPRIKAALAAAPLPAAPILVPDRESNYEILANFIDEVTKISDTIYTEVYEDLGLVEPAHRWRPRLVFRRYDETTALQSDGPVAMAPDNREPATGFRTGWTLIEVLNGRPVCPIRVPMEVGTSWYDILLHAATYATACQSATPLRRFVVCLGFNYVKNEFGIFIFHSGGAAASEHIGFDAEETRRSFLRFMLGLGLWQNALDAGDVPFFTGLTIWPL